jgi:hypothetical protein
MSGTVVTLVGGDPGYPCLTTAVSVDVTHFPHIPESGR